MPDKLTIEEFITRAHAVHGSRYDYSKTSYVNSGTKVCIICSKHGEFFQRPSNHTGGQNCYWCGREESGDKKNSNTKEFIIKAKAIHGDFYDYSEVEYVNNKKKICIICPEHGIFYQEPSIHLSGHGCRLCYNKKRELTQEQFIEKVRILHEGRYDYSKVSYKGVLNETCIICPIHGEFYQTPNAHIAGSGCPFCGRIRAADLRPRLNTDIFIKRSIAVHGVEKYDYSYVTFKAAKKKVRIICKIHEEFYQEPFLHMRGEGCKKCRDDKRRLSLEEFITRSERIHGKGTYDYSFVDYKNNRTEVCISCKIHGKFYQKPIAHLDSSGCPQCGNSIGERIIIAWFMKNNIGFKHNYHFSDLRGHGNKPLRFDFFTSGVRFLIEYDGEQHFKPVRFNGISQELAIENFNKTQYYDKLKNDYCVKNNIPLLRISYKEFNDISDILSEKLQEIGSSKIGKKKYLVNELNDKELLARDSESLRKFEEWERTVWSKIIQTNYVAHKFNGESNLRLLRTLWKRYKAGKFHVQQPS